ncbi:MAG TPA: helix-turn-helix domain-containing protein [Allosphingosinicella sp.]|nr:helix-turn-helix domain-containing protein [Allosphingosinicella sp.]
MTFPPSSLHNQYRLGDDDFLANFVARHDVLDALVRRLRATGKADRGLHHLLIGARGMGKTSLLRRLAIAVNRDEALAARYVPLSFREEQYNVLSLGDFWRNCGEALAEWADSNGRADMAERLDRAIDRGEWNDDEAAAERFAEEMKALERRAILLVDNLDLILAPLDAEDHWVLRRHLQAPDGPVMIGAVTQTLKESADRGAAFYEFFQPHYLEPLDEQETESCMRALSERRGEQGRPVVEVLDRQPERLRTLHNLTGGNPRVLALIYRLLESAETDAAMADLEILLDQVTPYYKARIEEYQTPIQRAVIDAIALNWDPITVGALSEATNIVANTLSGMLQKLRKDGLIEQVEGSGAYARHQIVERFLNIWYLMRHGTRRTRQKMRWLVEYLASFYAPDELAELARRYRGSWCGDYAIAADEAIARQSGATERRQIGWNEAAERELSVSATDASGDTALRAAIELNYEAVRQFEAGDFTRCLALLEDLITRFVQAREPALREQVAIALFNKGFTLGASGDSAGEVATYEELIARFGEAREPAVREPVAKALYNKALMLGESGDSAGEIGTYDELIARFGDAPEPALRKQVAEALFNKGVTLGAGDDSAGAITTYDELLTRFGEDPDPALRQSNAKALVNKGVQLGKVGDSAGAIATYDELISRFGEAPEPALHEQVAKALINKGYRLVVVGDSAAAIATYNELIGRFGEAPDPALRERVAKALFNKGFTHGTSGDSASEIATYDDLVARFGEASEPALREQVAKALFNKGYRLDAGGDSAGAIATFDELIARFGEAAEPALREQVAKALFNKGFTLDALGDWDASIGLVEKSVAIFSTLDEEQASLFRSVATHGLAILLIDRREDYARAEPLLFEAIKAFPERARLSLAWLYLLHGRPAEASRARAELEGVPAPERALFDAGLALASDDFGVAAGHLAAALGDDPPAAASEQSSDLERLLRLAERRGHGERLIAWFEESGFADRLAPVHAAFVAYVRGERTLLDVNPEVRRPARILYDRLDAPRRHRRSKGPASAAAKRGRGRPRKAGSSGSALSQRPDKKK